MVGIAGTAGLAIELVKLFQVELEHYEKIEGTLMSVEGKANRLATMIRASWPWPCRASRWCRCSPGTTSTDGSGRIFSYDVTGGCYEEHDHHSVGSGSLFARGALKKLWRPGLDRRRAPSGRGRGALDAADDDSATGGPDLGRRIWPAVAVVDGSRGVRFVAERRASRPSSRQVVADRRAPPAATQRQGGGADEHAVLRLARAADEGPGGLRPQGDRPRPVGRRPRLRQGHRVRRGEPSRALHKISEIYDRIAFAAVGKYNEFENLRVAGVRYADLRGYSYDRTDVTARGLANAYAQTLGTVFTQESKPYEVEIVVAEVGADRRARPDLPADLRRLGRRRARLRRHGWRSRADRDRPEGALEPAG